MQGGKENLLETETQTGPGPKEVMKCETRDLLARDYYPSRDYPA